MKKISLIFSIFGSGEACYVRDDENHDFGRVGGLTSSSDARAHLRVVWRTFLVQVYSIMVAFTAIHAARDRKPVKDNVKNK